MGKPGLLMGPSTVSTRLRELVGFIGCAALAVGLMVTPEPLAFDLSGALVGIAGTSPVTLPAMLLVAVVSAANLLAGTIVMCAIRGRPFDSVIDAGLWGFVGAVLLDLALVCSLGALDLFRAPILAAIHVGVIGVAWWRRLPLVAGSGAHVAARRQGWPLWYVALVVLTWSPAILLQLASPVPPFMDVLPNHTAPVEHLRTFGSFDPLTTTPSPIYGPSRTSLGFVAVLGTVATLAGIGAALAVSAFIVVEVLLVAAAAYRLALAFAGPRVGAWMLLTFALTQTFARLADDRSRVLVLPVAAVALVEFGRLGRARDVRAEDPWPHLTAAALALGATILFHAVIGAFVAATLLMLGLLDRRYRLSDAVAVVAVGGTLALPQAAIMIGVDLPAITGLLAVPAAALVAVILRVPMLRRAASMLTLAAIGATMLAALLFLPVPRAGRDWVGGFVHSVPILLTTAAIGLPFARSRLHPIVWAGVLVGAAAGTLAYALPSDTGVLALDAVRFEIPKEVHSWLPIFLALAAAVSLARFSTHVVAWQADGRARAASFAVVAGFVLLASLPARFEPIDPLYTGEHRIAENMAIHLRYAERGFFGGYPDSRRVVNAEQTQLLNAIRERISTGLIGADTRLLHVARTFRHWESTPVGTFTGVRVTTVSEDGGVTIHTVGGDLRTPDQLDELLASTDPSFPYLLLEPDTADRKAVRARIMEAGYRAIFGNAEGELFTRLPDG